MSFLETIARRRDGGIHSPSEIKALVQGATDGTIPSYQLSAWLMAAYLNPLTIEETVDLTLEMAASGEKLDLTGLPKPWVDKHSSGGVGDKTTIILLPMLAACGLTLVKMSGKGLGITGGTVDKLSSIPGFRTDLTPEEMIHQAKTIGLALTGQTPRLAPADGVLYALRDATETVRSIPLIASSILSKKIAGGADTILLDIKCGSGAFMHTLEEAQELCDVLNAVASVAGIRLKTEITDMNQPLGRAAGNALEVEEVVRILRNEEHSSLREFTIQMAADALTAAGVRGDCCAIAEQTLTDGSALGKAREWVVAQGGPASLLDDPYSVLERAPVRLEFASTGTGWVEQWDAAVVGSVVRDLGGGRKAKDDSIDLRVGVESLIEIGDQVVPGQVIARIHAATSESAQVAAAQLQGALSLSESPIERRARFLD